MSEDDRSSVILLGVNNSSFEKAAAPDAQPSIRDRSAQSGFLLIFLQPNSATRPVWQGVKPLRDAQSCPNCPIAKHCEGLQEG